LYLISPHTLPSVNRVSRRFHLVSKEYVYRRITLKPNTALPGLQKKEAQDALLCRLYEDPTALGRLVKEMRVINNNNNSNEEEVEELVDSIERLLPQLEDLRDL
jgi:hypothetical protein